MIVDEHHYDFNCDTCNIKWMQAVEDNNLYTTKPIHWIIEKDKISYI